MLDHRLGKVAICRRLQSKRATAGIGAYCGKKPLWMGVPWAHSWLHDLRRSGPGRYWLLSGGQWRSHGVWDWREVLPSGGDQLGPGLCASQQVRCVCEGEICYRLAQQGDERQFMNVCQQQERFRTTFKENWTGCLRLPSVIIFLLWIFRFSTSLWTNKNEVLNEFIADLSANDNKIQLLLTFFMNLKTNFSTLKTANLKMAVDVVINLCCYSDCIC